MIRRQPRSTRTDTLFPYTNALPIFQAAAVALLMATTVGLFVWASRTMGRNWSIVARTRADHRLVTTGPFAHVRSEEHPSELHSLMRISFAVFCFKHKK